MQSLTFSVLDALGDGKFHSGEALSKQFLVSRATIWSAIQTAQKIGVPIFSVRGRGYQLAQPLHLLNTKALNCFLLAPQDWHIEVLDQVDSTNSEIARRIHTLPHATCLASNLQTAGRGRRGRQWVSQLGASLTFSVLWRFECGAAGLSGLSLAVGLALARALKNFGLDAQLKWPNDILVNNKKLAGVLIELQGDMHGPSAAIIGVGINLALPDLSVINQPATDLARHGLVLDANCLLSVILQELQQTLEAFAQHGFAPMREDWQNLHAYQYQAIKISLPNGLHQLGQCMGVTDNGTMLLQTEEGLLQQYTSGEIVLGEGTNATSN